MSEKSNIQESAEVDEEIKIENLLSFAIRFNMDIIHTDSQSKKVIVDLSSNTLTLYE